MPRAVSALLCGGVLVGLAGCGGLAGEAASPLARGLRVPAVVTGPELIDDFDLGLLVPRRTRVRRIWKVESDQVLVEWTASRTPALYAAQLRGPWGLVLWTRFRSQGFASRWRSYALPLSAAIAPSAGITLGDVTSDGRRDILVVQYTGNHGCGPHRAIATIGRRPQLVYRAHVCETQLRAHGGQLQITDGAYRAGDGVCCPSFKRVTTKRWTGRRLVTVSVRLVRQPRP